MTVNVTWRAALYGLAVLAVVFLLGRLSGCQCHTPVTLPGTPAVVERTRDTVTHHDTTVRVIVRTRTIYRNDSIPADLSFLAGDTTCIPPFTARATTVDDGDTVLQAFTWESPSVHRFGLEIHRRPDSTRIETITNDREITVETTRMRYVTIGPAIWGGLDREGHWNYGAGLSIQFNLYGW